MNKFHEFSCRTHSNAKNTDVIAEVFLRLFQQQVNIMNWKVRLFDSAVRQDAVERDYHVRLEGMKPAYVIVELEITDPQKYEAYRQMEPATVEKFGGRFLVRGARVETVEGDWAPKRLVIVEFPSAKDAKSWLNSVEYASLKALRHESARTKMIIADAA